MGKRTLVLRLAGAWLATIAGCMAAGSALAGPPLPDTVKPPAGLNFGSTSFYDGFGRIEEGFTILNYGRLVELHHINGISGKPNPAFNDPYIRSLASLTQLSYFTPWHPFGGGVGFSALLPLVATFSHFDTPGVVLHSNRFGIGDLTWGPIFQSKPILADGRPMFDWRAQFLVNSPIGTLNSADNINQGSGYWAINPYIAFTYLPTPQIEISSRIHYYYAFETSRLAAPPPIPGLIYRSGQAGALAWANFTTSYAFSDFMAVGLNGYFVKQLTDDRTNNQNVPNTRQTQLYLGPGAHFVFDKSNILNLNLYLPVDVRTTASGTQINYQFIHRF